MIADPQNISAGWLVIPAAQQQEKLLRIDEKHEHEQTAEQDGPPQIAHSSPQSRCGSKTAWSLCIQIGDFVVVFVTAALVHLFFYQSLLFIEVLACEVFSGCTPCSLIQVTTLFYNLSQKNVGIGNSLAVVFKKRNIKLVVAKNDQFNVGIYTMALRRAGYAIPMGA